MGSAAVAGSGSGLYYAFAKLPDVGTLQGYVPFETTMLFDAHNRIIAKVHGEENRVVVPLGEIPPVVRNAVVAAEDIRFFQHKGVDPRGIARALLKDVAGGRAEEGASTLTQQLAKNLFLTPSKTIPRKLADAWLAVQIEQKYSKDQILELYLNQVYWGHNAYGIEAAAQAYFGKSVRFVNLAEGAMLAGLLGGPERFSPYKSPKRAKQHQRLVLRKMNEGGFITASQTKAATDFPLKVPHEPPVRREIYRAPYFTNFLLEQLVTRYGTDLVFKGGLRVYSTVDMRLQEKTEKLLRDTIAQYGKRYRFSQGAIVAIVPNTGAIRVMVGGLDWKVSKFNRVIQALRQPGSAFKPFLYLTAFAQGITPGTVMNDAAQTYVAGDGKVWNPQNYGDESYGNLTVRHALEVSNNIIAVKLINRVGVDKVLETAHRIGIHSNLQPNLSIALGTSEVTPIELCSAFGVFGNNGMRNEPAAYTRVEDRAGTILEERKPRPRLVFDPEPIKVLNDVMQGVILRGTGYAAKINRPAAGKTGTTSDHRDAWFVGYTPDLAAAVWVGNDDNSKMAGGTTGGEVCAPLWAKFMKVALEGSTPSAFVKPERMVEAQPPPQKAKVKPASGSIRLDDEAPEEDGTPKPLVKPRIKREPRPEPAREQETHTPPPREESREPAQTIDDPAP